MIETILAVLILGGTGAGLLAAYTQTRNFVTQRLRFVDAAQRRWAPWIAGVGTTLLTIPIFGGLLAFLPAISGATAVALGITVGAAVKNGQKQVKLLNRG
ncbi:MAG: hypothetical protein ACWGON_02025 [Gemmatimonadota bacterium]|jgi:hypothetical protein